MPWLVLPHVVDGEARVEHNHEQQRGESDELALVDWALVLVGVVQALIETNFEAVDIVGRKACEQHLERRVDRACLLVDIGPRALRRALAGPLPQPAGPHSTSAATSPPGPGRTSFHTAASVRAWRGHLCRTLHTCTKCRGAPRYTAVRALGEVKFLRMVEDLVKIDSTVRVFKIKMEVHTFVVFVGPPLKNFRRSGIS
eukprot:1449491-Pleurochrysis_carterae.AAC.2